MKSLLLIALLLVPGFARDALASQDIILVVEAGEPVFESETRRELVAKLSERSEMKVLSLRLSGDIAEDVAAYQKVAEQMSSNDLRIGKLVLDGEGFQPHAALEENSGFPAAISAHKFVRTIRNGQHGAMQVILPYQGELNRRARALAEGIRSGFDLSAGEILVVGTRRSLVEKGFHAVAEASVGTMTAPEVHQAMTHGLVDIQEAKNFVAHWSTKESPGLLWLNENYRNLKAKMFKKAKVVSFAVGDGQLLDERVSSTKNALDLKIRRDQIRMPKRPAPIERHLH
jgi:hypothetical protein